MKVALAGGGTGGHVYPLIAIAERLGEGEFFYFGTRRGAEARMVREMEFISIPAVSFPTSKKDFIGLIKFLFVLPAGILKSYRKLKKIKPSVLISSGGYVSVPVVIAARLLGIPVVIHEQNLVPGRANRILARFASAVGVSFKETKSLLRGRVFFTGYPLRKRIQKIDKNKARALLGIEENATVLLVTGGSRGARSINRAVARIADELLKWGLWVIHSTGIGTPGYRAYEDTREILGEKGVLEDGRYILKEYIHEMELAYSAADLIICRAGAGTVEEIKSVKIPAIFVPKLGLPGEHQLSNALPLKRAGVAEIAFEDYREGLSPEVLLQVLNRVLPQVPEMKKRFSIIEEEEPEIEIEELIKEVVKPPERINRKFYLIYRGEKHPLIFARNVISSSPFSSVRIRGLRRKLVFRIKNNQGFLDGYGEIKNGMAIDVDGITLKFVIEDKSEEEERERSFRGRFAYSAFGILVSRFFGFVREIFIGGYFGASLATDIFAVSLMIASFFRRVVAENAMDSAFLPTFLRVKRRGGDHWKLAYSVLVFFALAALGIVVVLELSLPHWFKYIAPGFVKKGVLSQGIALTRLMLPYLVIIAIAGWASSILKASDRFAKAEASSAFYSIGIILAVIFLSSKLNVFSLGVGVLLGGILQLTFLLWMLFSRETEKRLGKISRFSVSFQGAIWVVALLTLPILLDVSFSKLSDIVDKILATPLENGAVAALYFAAIVFRLPVNVIGNSINNVVLKDFSWKLASREREGALNVIYKGFELQFLTLLPATLFTFAFATPIIQLLFMRGAFGPRSVIMTASCLVFYSLSILAWGLSSMAGRLFAARLETHISMLTNAAVISLNVLLSIILVRTSLGFRGLALATSISLYFAVLIRFLILSMRMRRDNMEIDWMRIGKSFLRWTLASTVSVSSGYAFFRLLKGIKIISPFFSLLISFTLSLTLAVVFFVLFYFITRPVKHREREHPISPLLLPPEAMVDALARDPEPYRNDMELRAQAFLRSENWRMRNVGIKLVRIYGFERFRRELEEALRKESIGFIRRNAADALASLPPEQTSLEVLLEGCEDEYYEVRAACARTIGVYGISSERVRKTLYRLLQDRRFEVVKETIIALSLIFGEEIIEKIRPFYSHSNYEIRVACARALENLFSRGKIDSGKASEEAGKIMDISEGFKPIFPIKNIISRLRGEK